MLLIHPCPMHSHCLSIRDHRTRCVACQCSVPSNLQELMWLLSWHWLKQTKLRCKLLMIWWHSALFTACTTILFTGNMPHCLWDITFLCHTRQINLILAKFEHIFFHTLSPIYNLSEIWYFYEWFFLCLIL